MSWKDIVKAKEDEIQTALKEYHEFSDKLEQLKTKGESGLHPNNMENHFKEVKEVVERINELVAYINKLLPDSAMSPDDDRML